MLKPTPFRPQFQSTECGVAALRIVLAHFGKHVPAREIRQVTGVSRDCLSASDIRRGARHFGLDCKARRMEPDELREQKLPVIVHLRFIHFAVLEQIDEACVVLNCPASGRLTIARAHFDEDFTGIVLALSPGPGFTPQAARPSRLWQDSRKAACGGVLWSMGCGGVSGGAIAAHVQGSMGLVTMLGAVAVLALVHGFGWRFVQAALRRRIRTRLANTFEAVDFGFYVYRLPDVLLQVGLRALEIPAQLAASVATAVSGLAVLPPLIAIAIVLDARVGIVFLVCLGLWGAGCAVLLTAKRSVQRQWGSAGARHLFADALRQPDRVQLSDRPDRLILSALAATARQAIGRYRMRVLSRVLRAGPSLLSLGCLIIVVAMGEELGTRAAIGLALIGGTIGLFVEPLTELRGLADDLRHRSAMFDDLMDEPHSVSKKRTGRTASDRPGTGLIVENLTFAFVPNSRTIFSDVSFAIASGAQMGLTGPSGSGKSALTKVVAGLYPRQGGGSIRIDGTHLADISLAERSRWIARVDRAPVIFAGSIRENIVLEDDRISEADLTSAVEDACLTDVISKRPLGLDAPVEAFGRNFSGGQLQRLEIARALARNPKVLILDDAFDALDSITELAIRKALRRRNCSLLLVSHRTSTLAACDHVLHFVQGTLVDAGAAEARPVGAAQKPRTPWTDSIGTEACEPRLGSDDTAFGRICRLVVGAGTAKPLESADCSGLTRASAVHRFARQNDLLARRVRLTDPHWVAGDIGPALAFGRRGYPLVLCSRRGRNRLFDGFDAVGSPIDAATASAIDPLVWSLVRPMPMMPRRLHGWQKHLLRVAYDDVTWLVLLGLVCGLMPIGLLIAASRPADLGLIPLLGGAGLFWLARNTAADRLQGKISQSESIAAMGLAAKIAPDAVRSLSLDDIQGLSEGLTAEGDRLFTALDIGAGAATSLVAAMIALWWWSGWAAAAAAFGVLAIACSEMAWEVVRARRAPALFAAQRAANRQFAITIFGMGQLRSLAADRAALRQWQRLDDKAQRLARLDARREQFRSITRLSLRLLIPMAVGLDAMGRTGNPPTSVGFAWIAAAAAVRIGPLLAKWLFGRERTDARRLLALPRQDGDEQTAADAIIHAVNISHAYAEGGRLFSNLTLSVDPRQFTIITGPSGIGKSTLLRILLGLQDPEIGDMRLGDRPMRSANPRWRRRITGIFQGDLLDMTATIRAQIDRNRGLDVAEIWRLLEIVELADDVRAMPMGLQSIVEANSLSAGQQQRLLLARVLSESPRLVVLDEATNAVPEDVQARILGRLRQLGIGCLIATHRESVLQSADVVHRLRPGGLLSTLTRAEIARRPSLAADIAREAG